MKHCPWMNNYKKTIIYSRNNILLYGVKSIDRHIIHSYNLYHKTYVGCGAAVATSSMATELVKGRTVQEEIQAALWD